MICFGKNAVNINKYLKKGDPILLEGSLGKVEAYINKNGKAQAPDGDVILEKFQFLGKKSKEENDSFDNNSISSSDYESKDTSSEKAPDISRPLIVKYPVIKSRKQNSATIEWENNEVSDGFIYFGLDTTDLEQAGSESDKRSHSISLTNLLSDTTYYFSVRAVDVTGLYSDPLFVKVDLTLPESVTLISPLDSVRVLEARLEWQKVMAVDGYRVQVKKSGVQVWSADNVKETHVTVPENKIESDSTYTWTVEYVKNGVYSAPSNEGSFIYTKWPTTFEYVSDMQETYWKNGWGDGNKNLSEDGNPILIAGVQYDKGLGMHAAAEVNYALDGNYDYFMAVIGHDDEANGGNGVIFKVVADNDTVFTSKPMIWGEPGQLIKVRVTNADTLKLILDTNGDGGYDHADWANAIIYKLSAQGVASRSNLVPTTTELIGNYPNPFNPNTTIEFNIAKTEFVELNIYNTMGQKVDVLVSEELPSGSYTVDFSGQNLASGIYFYTLSTSTFVATKKMILLK